MHTITRFILVVAIAIMSTGCAVQMRNGRTLFPFGEPQSVIIHSNGSQWGEIEVNGRPFAELPVGGTVRLYLPYNLYSNVVVSFKAYDYVPGVRKVYLGIITRTFTPTYGYYSQEWTIDFVQPRLNQFQPPMPAVYGGRVP